MCVCVCSVVSDAATPWTVACLAPLSMEFSRKYIYKNCLHHQTGMWRDVGPPLTSPFQVLVSHNSLFMQQAGQDL